MPTDAVWTAMITGGVVVATALITGVVGPVVMARQLNRSRNADKKLDWERQDQVAAAAAAASRQLLERQDAATHALEENTKSAGIGRQKIDSQLTAIHGIVNNNMTLALQSDLDSIRRELAALIEIRELKRAAGQDVSKDTLIAIEQAKTRIVELEKTLIERREQDKVATAQVDQGNALVRAADAAALAAPAAAENAARKIVPPVVTEVVPPVVKEAVKQALEEHDKKDA